MSSAAVMFRTWYLAVKLCCLAHFTLEIDYKPRFAWPASFMMERFFTLYSCSVLAVSLGSRNLFTTVLVSKFESLTLILPLNHVSLNGLSFCIIVRFLSRVQEMLKRMNLNDRKLCCQCIWHVKSFSNYNYYYNWYFKY